MPYMYVSNCIKLECFPIPVTTVVDPTNKFNNKLGAKTLGIMTFSITTFTITTLSIKGFFGTLSS